MAMVRPILSAAVALSAACVLLAACNGGDGGDGGAGPGVARTEFVSLATNASCANLRNRLLVIDNKMVLWDKAGTCADAGYAQTLYGATPQQLLCSHMDSIAGPRTECPSAQHASLFATVTQHLDRPDLGLGSGHVVEVLPVPAGASTTVNARLTNARLYRGAAPGPVVIRDAAGWNDFWRTQADGAAPLFPVPDFSRQMVVGVFSAAANPCNQTRIARVASDGQSLTVEFLDLQITAVQACSPTPGTPMSLAIVDAIPLPVRFESIGANLPQVNTIAQSDQSGIANPLGDVVKDATGWQTLWTQYVGNQQPAPALPAVDFNQRMVAAVALGRRPSGCEVMRDVTVWRSHGRIRIAHYDMVPGPTTACAAVTIAPAALLELPRSDDAVEFIGIPTPL